MAVGTAQLAALNRNRRGDPVVDRALTVARIMRPDGAAIAEIVNFAAHPTLYDDDMMQISPDWPGTMCSRVESAAGGVCLFLNGAEGDASVLGADGATPADRIATYGAKLADAALAVRTRTPGPAEGGGAGPLRIWSQPVALPARKADGLFLLAAGQLGIGVPQARELVNALMPQSTAITFVRLGPLLLIGFPCEPAGALGLKAKEIARSAGFADPAVVALTNAWLAYALTPEQYRAGKYEAGMSFYGEGFGPALLAAVKNGVRK